MRKEESNIKLTPTNAFRLNRFNSNNNYETGLSATLGFDYEIKKEDRKLDFSVSQIINQKENKKMSSESSLDEKLSDFVGTSKLSLGDKFKFDYNLQLKSNNKNKNKENKEIKEQHL